MTDIKALCERLRERADACFSDDPDRAFDLTLVTAIESLAAERDILLETNLDILKERNLLRTLAATLARALTIAVRCLIGVPIEQSDHDAISAALAAAREQGVGEGDGG